MQSLPQQHYKIPILTTHSQKPLTQFLQQTHSKHPFHLLISTQPHPPQKPNPQLLKPLFHHYHLKPQHLPILP
ncbi:HAD hydrolase-like protein, partial [Staphylococcus hominis]|uniref:HAD hydrolase-like protein n=1 Tax=Staphylococcus hominis TaxID=1290 RepID=UPI0037094CC0